MVLPRIVRIVVGSAIALALSLAVRNGFMEDMPVVNAVLILVLSVVMMVAAFRLSIHPGPHRNVYADLLVFGPLLTMALTGMAPWMVALFAVAWLAAALYVERTSRGEIPSRG